MEEENQGRKMTGAKGRQAGRGGRVIKGGGNGVEGGGGRRGEKGKRWKTKVGFSIYSPVSSLDSVIVRSFFWLFRKHFGRDDDNNN